MSVGDELAAARRAAGLTITQVSQRTCIRETIVRGIERGDYSACGGDFYARGHVRSIARTVGLDPEEMVAEYDATQAPPPPITAAEVFQPFTPVKLRERRRPNWSVVLLAGLVALAAIVGLRYVGSTSPRHTAAHASTRADGRRLSASAHPSVSASVSQAVAQQVQLTITAGHGQETWAQITGPAGKVLFQGLIGAAAGVPAKSVTAKTGPVTVQMGNPGGATLVLNGKKQAYDTTHPVTLTCTVQACH